MRKRKNRSARGAVITTVVVLAMVGACVFSLYSLGKHDDVNASVSASDTVGTGTGKLLTRIDAENDSTAVAYVSDTSGSDAWQYDDASSWTASSDPRVAAAPEVYEESEQVQEQTQEETAQEPATAPVELAVQSASINEELTENVPSQSTEDNVIKSASAENAAQNVPEVTAVLEDEIKSSDQAMMAAAQAFGPHNLGPEYEQLRNQRPVPAAPEVVDFTVQEEPPVSVPEQAPVLEEEIVEEPVYEEPEMIPEPVVNEPVYEEEIVEEPVYEEPEIIPEPEEIIVYDSQIDEVNDPDPGYIEEEYSEPEEYIEESYESEGEWVFDYDTEEWIYVEGNSDSGYEETYEEAESEETYEEEISEEGEWVYDYDIDEWVYVEGNTEPVYEESYEEVEEVELTETDEEEFSEEGEWVYDEELDEWVYVEESYDSYDETDDESEESEVEDGSDEEIYEEPYSSLGQEIVNYAMGFVGVTPYVPGGRSLYGGTDCSGFVNLIYGDFGIYCSPASLAYDGSSFGYIIGSDQARAGDIAVYGGGSHVAIYAGNGYVVHCSSPENGTVYWNMNYRGDFSWFLRVID